MTQIKTGNVAKLLFLVTAGLTLVIAPVFQNAHAKTPPAFDTGLENQLGLTFTPDGSTAFWVAWNGDWGSRTTSPWVIYTSKQEHGKWSAPTPAEFSGNHSDSGPFVSRDGRCLYFVSERPTSNDDESNDRNIWRYSLVEGSHVLSFDAESLTLAVSNVDSGSVTLINIDSGDTKVVKLAAGSEASLVAEGRIWVANAIDRSVSVVDPRKEMAVEHIDSVCKFPIALGFDMQKHTRCRRFRLQ